MAAMIVAGATFLYCVVPISLATWLACLYLHSHDEQEVTVPPISPFKFLMALLLPVFMAVNGARSGKLTPSGSVAALLIGWILCFINYTLFICVAAFYLVGSKATKFRSNRKSFERDSGTASARNWVQVLCNGGVAMQLTLFYYLDVGCIELPIDFQRLYSPSWWAVGALSATACSSGDTLASELGPVLPFSQPYLVTTMRKVPKGTNGGVSLAGTLASALGGFVVGISFYLSLVLMVRGERDTPQWPIIVVCTMSGVMGSLIDSLLGATLQYSGQAEDGCIVEIPERGARDIAGFMLLDNHSVNLLSAIITSMIVPSLAVQMWPMLCEFKT